MHYVGGWVSEVHVGKTLQFMSTSPTISISRVVNLQQVIHVEMEDRGDKGEYAEDEPYDETWDICALTLGCFITVVVPGTGSSSNV